MKKFFTRLRELEYKRKDRGEDKMIAGIGLFLAECIVGMVITACVADIHRGRDQG